MTMPLGLLIGEGSSEEGKRKRGAIAASDTSFLGARVSCDGKPMTFLVRLQFPCIVYAFFF